MLHTSRDPRTTDTKDLSARLRSNGHSCVVGRVLNLRESGMFVITSSDLEVTETARFELSGHDFCYAGLAKVARQEDRAMGLRFLSWQGPVDRPVRTLVAARLRGRQLESHHADTWGVRRATVSDSRGHDRAVSTWLSAVIEQSPGGMSRHQVLNVSEHGLGIDGLTLAIGDRISFLLAGRGMNHLGRGRVAYRTGTITGIAVDHWHGAPEAIRALLRAQRSGEGDRRD